MQTKFMLNLRGKEQGPFTEFQVREMLASQHLQASDLFFEEVSNQWVAVGDRFKPMMKLTPQNSPGMNPPPPLLETDEFEVIEPKAKKVDSPNHSPISGEKIKFSGGVGTVRLQQTKAGHVQLKLKSAEGLAVNNDLSLVVQAAAASKIKLKAAPKARAGESFSIHLEAVDAFDNLATDFKEVCHLEWTGSKAAHSLEAHFEKGLATVHFKPTLAEVVSLKFKEAHPKNLSFPKPWEVSVKPNVAVRLVAEGPQNALAGEDIAVKVTALDAYENIVTDFNGELNLAVETTVEKKAS